MFTNKALAFGRRNRHLINFAKSIMVIEQNAGRMNAWRMMPKLQFLIILLMLFGNFVEGMMPIGSTNPQQQLRPTSIEQQDRENKQFLASLRIRALHNLQRSLETLSSLTANSLMLNAALQSSESAAADEDETNEENDEIDIGGGGEDRAEANETQLNEATTKMATAAIRSKDRRHQQQRHQQQQQQPPDASSAVLDPHLRHNSSPPPTSSSTSSQQSSGATSSTTNSDELQSIRPHRHGVRRIRADLKQMPPTIQQEEKSEILEGPTTTTMAEMQMTNPRGAASSAERSVTKRNKQHRRMRSTSARHHSGHGGNGHHKRRRKGCPTVHGKDQLLCPTRNTHRYDVCITREQLCDRIRDCPGGEDEDSRHCFFFRPLETSLKTISHAVLLLVDTVMREQEEHQQQMEEQRNEL